MDKETIFGIGFWIVLIGGIIGWNVLANQSPKTQPVRSTPQYEFDTSDFDSGEPTDRHDNSEIKKSSPRIFGGYPCTVDCSGHEAGSEWAEEHGITDPDDCGGNSQSFIEGCQSYAEENSDNTDSSYDEDE